MDIPHRVVSSLPQGTALSRYLVAKSMGMSLGVETAEGWRDVPQVAYALKGEIELRSKASVDPMSTSDPSAAAPLARAGITQEFLALLRGPSPVLQLRDRGMQLVPANVQIPRETGAGVGAAWIAEGAPMPIVADAFVTTSTTINKEGVIIVASKELFRVNPQTESILRTITVNGTAGFEGRQFLDPSITAIPFHRPASITNGSTQITSTGGTGAQIAADLAAMIQGITTAGTSLVWIMTPITAATIAARLAVAGTSTDLPRSLFGIPAIITSAAPARQITLVDASAILYSDEGLDISIVEHATVEMSNTPTSPPTASTIAISLWTHNLVGIRVTRWVSWLRAQPGSVTYMTTTY